MKANGMPERIYIFDYNDAMVTPMEGDTVYVREDAFIEKALANLNEKFYFNNAFYGVVSTDFNAMEEMYEDFRNYMKEE